MPQHSVVITGNIVSPPFIRNTHKEHKVLKFRVACSRGRYDMDASEWKNFDQLFVDVDCWDNLAHNAHASLSVGMAVIVVGHLVTQEWTNDAGDNRSRIVLKANHVGVDMNKYMVAARENKDFKELAKQLNSQMGQNNDAESSEDSSEVEALEAVNAGDAHHEEGMQEHEPALAGAAHAEGDEPPF